MSSWLLPHAHRLRPLERRLLGAAALLLIGMILVATLVGAFGAVTGAGDAELETLILEWVSPLVGLLAAGMVTLRAARVREARAAWTALAVGLWLYAAGNVVWAVWLEPLASPPFPSLSDALWLSLYPLSYLGIVLLARSDRRRVPAGVWLDGIVAGLGIAALGAALVFHRVLESATGEPAAVITSLAYPLVDLLLAALVMGMLALRGWRLDRTWTMFGLGFLALSLSDSILLVEVSGGATTASFSVQLFYILGGALLALAPWQPPPSADAQRLEGWSVLLAPAIFSLAALGVLVYDHFARLDHLAVLLAILTLLAALLRAALTFRDVRDLAETRRQAVTDDLTSLPNRRLFLRRLEEATAAGRAANEPVALLIVDLDHFKELNDTLGHHSGDELLRHIGPRLYGMLRAGDTVARLGGDEFGLVIGPPADELVAVQAADRVIRALAEPFQVHDLSLHVSASVGIALYPEHGKTADELLQRADVAMYHAKTTGTGSEVYQRERDAHSRERLALIGELRQGLQNGELEAYFQPKVGAGDRCVVGAEALVRWHHPERGLVAPGEFLPLAEQAGLLRPLTRVVLDQAVRQCREWLDKGLDLHVAVNMSATDLLDGLLPGEVAGALERHGLPPSALMIEITETSVLTDPVRIGDVLARLGELGVGLSLDDFGTGYSSLAHLKTLPVQEVKIDRSFVASMGADAADRAIVTSTIGLAHDLGMRVVAEGVEDDATWELLTQLGCELIQGYAFARPLPADELAPLLGGAALGV